MHRDVINKVIWKMDELNIKAPQNNGDDECLKFCYLGYCNSDCKRKNNHIPVKPNSDRFNALKTFRNKALEVYNKNKTEGDQDFH